MLSAASSSSYLTPQMEARTGQPPLLRPPGVHRLLFRLPLTRPGSRLPVCVPISLSSCLLLFTALSFMLGRPFPPPSPPPQSSCTLVTHTHAHTQETHIDAHKGNIMLGLFHSLSCTSSSGSTASTCINAPHRSIKGSHLDPVCRVG